MALELRELRDDVLGALSAPALTTDQQLASSTFSSLPDYYSTTRYLPLVLANDTLQTYEVVYVTGHAAGVNTVTVQRGREGTLAQEWAIGDALRVAPTWRDIGAPMVFTNGGLVPADLAVGARYVLADEKVTREKTMSQGGLPSLRSSVRDLNGLMSSPLQFLPGVPGGPPSQGLVPRLKAFPVGPIVTQAGGYIDIYWDGNGPNNGWTWQAITDEPNLSAVSAAWFVPHLTGSDATWQGDCAVNLVFGSGLQAASVRFFSPTGVPFANRQVRGALVVIGV